MEERWDAGSKTLSGRSAVVAGDPYVLTVHLPKGYRIEGADVGGEKAEVVTRGETVAVRIVPPATKTVQWKVVCSK